VDPYVNDWLNFLLRWLHVVAAIVWIGTSFYFVALDNHLRPPERREDDEEGVGGETWEVHGGGFYRVQKFRVAPHRLPEPLHWFKWEAYTTWLSGFALLITLYYVNADELLVDATVADLSVTWAIVISIALLAAAWLAYDVLCRLLGERQLLLAAAVFGLAALSAWGAGELFAARAAWLQVGAMLGTIMVANVFFVIMPGHWELVRAKEAGREPDPVHGVRGKQRSVHNNYLTLPVVIAMIGGHFPAGYAHGRAWAVLVALMAVGALIRHYFNLRHAGRTLWPIPAVAAVAVAGIALAIRPADEEAPAASAQPVDPAAVASILERRCAPCHSGASAPAGVRLESLAQAKARAEQVRRLSVESRAMPPGNATEMTDAERETLGAWLAAGAPGGQAP
jgi:uncharacterized membrane protein